MKLDFFKDRKGCRVTWIFVAAVEYLSFEGELEHNWSPKIQPLSTNGSGKEDSVVILKSSYSNENGVSVPCAIVFHPLTATTYLIGFSKKPSCKSILEGLISHPKASESCLSFVNDFNKITGKLLEVLEKAKYIVELT